MCTQVTNYRPWWRISRWKQTHHLLLQKINTLQNQSKVTKYILSPGLNLRILFISGFTWHKSTVSPYIYIHYINILPVSTYTYRPTRRCIYRSRPYVFISRWHLQFQVGLNTYFLDIIWYPFGFIGSPVAVHIKFHDSFSTVYSAWDWCLLIYGNKLRFRWYVLEIWPSSLFLNELREGASTTEAGRLFQSLTTRMVKNFCLMDFAHLLFSSWKTWPRVLVLLSLGRGEGLSEGVRQGFIWNHFFCIVWRNELSLYYLLTTVDAISVWAGFEPAITRMLVPLSNQCAMDADDRKSWWQ